MKQTIESESKLIVEQRLQEATHPQWVAHKRDGLPLMTDEFRMDIAFDRRAQHYELYGELNAWSSNNPEKYSFVDNIISICKELGDPDEIWDETY